MNANKSLVRRGFTLVEIMIVILIIGILLAIAVPGFIQARQSGRRSSCLQNLKHVDGAKEQWAMDNNMTNGQQVGFTDIVGPSLYLKSQPSCPGGGTYSVNVIGVPPTCTVSDHVLP